MYRGTAGHPCRANAISTTTHSTIPPAISSTTRSRRQAAHATDKQRQHREHHRLEVREPADRRGRLVAVRSAARAEGVRAGDERTPGRDRRNPEPQHEQQYHCANQHPAHRGHRAPGPDHVQTEERPRLGAPERSQQPERERPSVAPGELHVDRAEAQPHDHRVRLAAEDDVRVARDQQDADAGDDGRDPAGDPPPPIHLSAVRPARLPRHQPVRDPPSEHGPAEREGDDGHQPQVHRVMADHGEGHREQVGERLPGWGGVRVECEMERLLAPHEPAVRIEPGPRPGPHDDSDRQHADRHADRPPRLGPGETTERPRDRLARRRVRRRPAGGRLVDPGRCVDGACVHELRR